MTTTATQKSPLSQLKKILYRTVSDDVNEEWYSWTFDVCLIVLITLTAVSITLESVNAYEVKYFRQFHSFEIFTITFFSIEYIIRIWTITEEPKYKHPLWGRLRYAISVKGLIDLLAILPFYLTFLPFDLRFLRLFRLLKIFKILKIVRYIKALHTIKQVFKVKREELWVSMSFVLIMLIVASTFMYYIESEAQPDKFASIPETMWWAAVTLTSVGYGDVYPITGLGKLFGGFISILGIALVGLPAAILAAGFVEELNTKQKPRQKIARNATVTIALSREEVEEIICEKMEEIYDIKKSSDVKWNNAGVTLILKG